MSKYVKLEDVEAVCVRVANGAAWSAADGDVVADEIARAARSLPAVDLAERDRQRDALWREWGRVMAVPEYNRGPGWYEWRDATRAALIAHGADVDG